MLLKRKGIGKKRLGIARAGSLKSQLKIEKTIYLELFNSLPPVQRKKVLRAAIGFENTPWIKKRTRFEDFVGATIQKFSGKLIIFKEGKPVFLESPQQLYD